MRQWRATGSRKEAASSVEVRSEAPPAARGWPGGRRGSCGCCLGRVDRSGSREDAPDGVDGVAMRVHRWAANLKPLKRSRVLVYDLSWWF